MPKLLAILFLLTATLGSCSKKMGCPSTQHMQTKTSKKGKKGNEPWLKKNQKERKKGESSLMPKGFKTYKYKRNPK